jgi:dihydrofolate reductase
VEPQNTTVLSGNPASAITTLRDEVDGVILVAGSATLVQTLVDNDLIDELRLMVFPVLLGQGKRLFPEGEAKKALKLIGAQTVGDGVSILRYERV